MRRYHTLLAGASWMAEFGNPDLPEEWAYLQHNSPYHTLGAGASAPPTLFTTSTRDDRVHPGHARKMVAKMGELGLPALYYENIEGGHGGAADNKQRAYMAVVAYSFLHKALFDGGLKDVRAPKRGNSPLRWAVPVAVAGLAVLVAVVAQRRRAAL